MTTMIRLLATALAATGIAVSSGCANHPELRPYTTEQSRQLQLEALQRQGLSPGEYEQRRMVILRKALPRQVAASYKLQAAS
ncbi:hypothetical protein [Pseudomonas putida]